ncbi:nitrous oxide reductase accessory protein NosL [Thermodesulfobacteriota bacterium]
MSMRSLGTLVLFVSLAVVMAAVGAIMWPGTAAAEDPCAVKHPLMPPNKEFSGQCPNCGMMRPVWARTWKSFENSQGKFSVCSFHCLADMAIKSGEDPKDVTVALFLEPKKMITGKEAFFVVGSKVKGTMTMKSKVALASREKAEAFAKACGGKVVALNDAMKMAKAAVAKENKVIAMMRLKKGAIVEPVDNKDSCSVCSMYPARYPKNKCQIVAKDKKVYHFCSTKCMFKFLGSPDKFAKGDFKPAMIWVSDYPTGASISAKTAYYVVGSKAQGPMGVEAFSFDKKRAAQDFSGKQGGKVLVFSKVKNAKIDKQ